MNKRLPCASFACLLAFPLLACDDDERRSPPPYASGLNSEAPVSQLDDAEKRQICQRYQGYVDAHVGFDQLAYVACLPTSILFGRTREGCEEYLYDCVRSFPDPVVIRAQLHDQECFEKLDACNATVGELEGCINLNLGFLINVLENFSCLGAEDSAQVDAARDLMGTANVCALGSSACSDFATIELY